MGRHTDNSNHSSLQQYTAKGNVLYKFEHLTQDELNAYRVGSYGYIM